MKKEMYQWVWKWHFIGGIISLPIIMILSLTGIIYLFKDDYEASQKKELQQIELRGERLSFDKQYEIAQESWEKDITSVVVPQSDEVATEFNSGRFSHKSSLYVDPSTGKVNGKVQVNKTDMHVVRKLHGELLGGKFGTKIVELIGCWMIALIITGIYLFWPRDKGWKGFFTVRFNATKRILLRDLHAVTGFWFSVILLIILAGGLPWTDVWGEGFKIVQEKTHTGFPRSWFAVGIQSQIKDTPLSLDVMIEKAKDLELVGIVSVSLPKGETAVYSISNQTTDLDAMVNYHYDQYTGELLHQDTWQNIGILMRARLWAMTFHQGQFGLWNWWLIFITAISLFLMSLSGLIIYLKRKQKGSWGIPTLPNDFKIEKGLIGLIIFLSLFLPLFGLSVALIFVIEKLTNTKTY